MSISPPYRINVPSKKSDCVTCSYCVTFLLFRISDMFKCETQTDLPGQRNTSVMTCTLSLSLYLSLQYPVVVRDDVTNSVRVALM